jgi:hypothetical protein
MLLCKKRTNSDSRMKKVQSVVAGIADLKVINIRVCVGYTNKHK